MATIVQLVQGSPEWLAHRKQYRNASETPAVLGLSPWVTPYQLWLQRTGRAEAAVNPAMRRGTELEPLARRAYEQLTRLVMEPLVLVDGQYSASLDGITLDGELILEVKCPVKGTDSELWNLAQSGKLAEHYMWQVQHQLMVAGAKLAHVWVWTGSQGFLLEQRPEHCRWDEIRKGWDDFQKMLEANTPPPLTERDTAVRSDPEWAAAASAFAESKAAADAATSRLETAKQRLVSLATHARVEGAGVSVTRFWKSGNVEYKRVPELEGIDLEQYRGQGREEIRVTVQR